MTLGHIITTELKNQADASSKFYKKRTLSSDQVSDAKVAFFFSVQQLQERAQRHFVLKKAALS